MLADGNARTDLITVYLIDILDLLTLGSVQGYSPKGLKINDMVPGI